jgi:hypothetical protein
MPDPLIQTTIPCYEIAASASEGEVLRFRPSNPSTEGFSYVTIATKDVSLQGKVKPGKNYKITIEEVP